MNLSKAPKRSCMNLLCLNQGNYSFVNHGHNAKLINLMLIGRCKSKNSLTKWKTEKYALRNLILTTKKYELKTSTKKLYFEAL